QLYATNENVKGVSDDLQTVAENASKYLGGGADVLEGTEPTYKLDDKEYHDLSGAFGGVDQGFKDLKDQVAQNKDEVSERLQDALLWDNDKGAFVAQHGADKSNSKITSLKAGSISKDSSDAVIGSQLYGFGSDVAQSLGGGAGYENGHWTGPHFKFKGVNTDGSSEDKSYDNVSVAFAGIGDSFE
ncbi:hypothetical protein ACFFLC_17825, partial [Brachybacterium conglomeratum]